jgi:glycosyltransferase involved in cell wall biosynthesis
LRIAAFGFRSYPPQAGSAGADKFASELLPRLASRGHSVVAYNRVYSSAPIADTGIEMRDGVVVVPLRTVRVKGFDTIIHSARSTYDILRHNRADIIHMQNGGNSIFGAILRLFGKKTFLSQDGLDWQREKWPWYAKLYLFLSSYLTAHVHNAVIFDNIYAREHFAARFGKKYDFIPFGADVDYVNVEGSADHEVLKRLGLNPSEYFLFVGRFIPDKGLHWLIPAFENLQTEKKLVLVGGSPNPSEYEDKIKCTTDQRIIFPGFMYGSDVHELMSNAFAYIQPSAIEGLSPVILEAAYLGAPIICTDIPQNRFAMDEHAVYFRQGDSTDLTRKLHEAVSDPTLLRKRASAGSQSVATRFCWDSVVGQHEDVFRR